LAEYEKAPKVTRQRLYIDAMQSVMSKTSKVMVDVDGGNLMYLPLDKLMKQSGAQSSGGSSSSSFGENSRQPMTASRNSNSRSTSRETR
jgi:membrane protease subunit HflK